MVVRVSRDVLVIAARTVVSSIEELAEAGSSDPGIARPRVTRAELAGVVALLLLVAYGWLGANLFAGEIVAPMDLLLHRPGWAESGLEWPLSRTKASDVIDGHLPKWIFLKQELLGGRVPFWNPMPGGGQPAFGILSHGYFTPRFLLFLLFDEGLGYTLGLLAQATLSALGIYLLCRTALGVLPSLFGGFTYMMCGFNSIWAMWPHVATSLWLPWIFWASIRLAERPSGRRAALLAVFVSLLVLGGYPPVAAFGFYGIGL
ncbi:MAG: hypothetical protein ACREQY_10130, partial [Candidatus Binatia bacterium]